ncbi:MAG: hypothetical protein ABI894_16485 [Ilumatobacteraceae bacterium]
MAATVASIYRGFYGAGLGIMLLAVLGLFSELPFNRSSAVKTLVIDCQLCCRSRWVTFSAA